MHNPVVVARAQKITERASSSGVMHEHCFRGSVETHNDVHHLTVFCRNEEL